MRLPSVLKIARDALLCPKHTSKRPIMQQIKLQFDHEQYAASLTSREQCVGKFFLYSLGHNMQNLEYGKMII